jgi:hypothetical protein
MLGCVAQIFKRESHAFPIPSASSAARFLRLIGHLLPIAEWRLFLEEETEISLVGVAACRNYVVIQAQPHG